MVASAQRRRSIACQTGQSPQSLDGPLARIVRYGYSQIQMAVDECRSWAGDVSEVTGRKSEH